MSNTSPNADLQPLERAIATDAADAADAAESIRLNALGVATVEELAAMPRTVPPVAVEHMGSLILGWYLMAHAAHNGRTRGWCPLRDVAHRVIDAPDSFMRLEKNGLVSRVNDVGEHFARVDVGRLELVLERLSATELMHVTRSAMQMIWEDARERV